MSKLCQILAVEKRVKTAAAEHLTKMYQALQKPQLLQGIAKTYESLNEDGEKFPAENKRVEVNAKKCIGFLVQFESPMFDLVYQRDDANRIAVADVMLDGKVFLAAVPAITLIWLEKHLTDLFTTVKTMPELPSDEDWEWDVNKGCYASAPSKTSKMKKVNVPILLAPATPEHPAQVQMGTEDILQGYWTTVKFSGALPVDEKEKYLQRIGALVNAVKQAREIANQVDAPPKTMAKEVFGFIFA